MKGSSLSFELWRASPVPFGKNPFLGLLAARHAAIQIDSQIWVLLVRQEPDASSACSALQASGVGSRLDRIRHDAEWELPTPVRNALKLPPEDNRCRHGG